MAQPPRVKRPGPAGTLGLLRRPREMGAKAQSLLWVRLEFPPRATGAGVSLRSWTKGPTFAFRRGARGLWAEVTEGQAPCRGPGGDAARTRHGPAFGAFHTFSPPETALGSEEAPGAAWGSFCALGVCWAFSFRRKLLHPFPLESPALSLEVGKRLRRVRRRLSSSLSRSQTLKTRDVWPQADIWGQGEGASSAFLGPLPPTWPLGSPPPPGTGRWPRLVPPAAGAAGLSPGMWRRGMCMQMSPARGGAAGRARAGRMLIARK